MKNRYRVSQVVSKLICSLGRRKILKQGEAGPRPCDVCECSDCRRNRVEQPRIEVPFSFWNSDRTVICSFSALLM